MKINKMFLAAITLATALFTVGCNDDDTTIIELGAKTRLTLDRYYGSNGSLVVPVWNAADKGAVMVAGEGKSAVSYAAPIVPGAASSLFLFEVQGWDKTPSTLISYYPSTLDVTCTGGNINYKVATEQNGTITPCLIGYDKAVLTDYEGADITLRQAAPTLFVNIARGNYSISSLQVKGNGTATLAGNVTYSTDDSSVSADAQTINVSFSQPLSCKDGEQRVAVMVAPVTLPEGYTVVLNTTDGESIERSFDEPVTFEFGSKNEAGAVSNPTEPTIVFCGSDRVCMVNPTLVNDGLYLSGLTWDWDAKTMASYLGIAASRCNHLDDCKPVDNGKKLLMTSSYNWAVLLDIESKQPLWWTNGVTNAHSADLLPGNKVVVACSDNGDALQVYDLSNPNIVLFSTPLPSAHGVVWNDATQRLYAIGGQKLNIYVLTGADTQEPKLDLEKSIATPQSGLHDLTMADPNTLVVSGKRSYLYSIGTNSFTENTLFNSSTALKSVNYNPETGACWYTDATVPEGTQSWSTQTLHYTTNVNGNTDDRTISVPDQDVYKVRVLNW